MSKNNSMFHVLQILAMATGLAAAAGCGGASSGPWPEARPLGRDLDAYRAPARPTSASDAPARSSGADPPSTVLSLKDALAFALERSPELAASSWEVRAAEARAVQAALRPNPEIELEVEEFGGTHGRRDFDGAVVIPAVTQEVELGGKRSKRKRVALLDTQLAGWDYESKRLDVYTEVRMAFIAVLAGQERVLLAEELVRLSDEVYSSVAERVNAGKVSPLEETKASVTLSTSRIERDHAKRDLAVARKRLSITWGNPSPTFERVEGQLESPGQVPPVETLVSRVAGNPEVARWTTAIEQRRAAIEMEKAGRIPDLTLSGGVQQFRETGDRAFKVGISIPFPIFDRNQGAVRETESALAKANEERRAVEVRVRGRILETHELLTVAHSEARSLGEVVLPAARRAFEAAEEGYRSGKLGYLDVLDAQRTYFQVKEQWVQALSAYHGAVAEMERLIGGSLREAGGLEPNQENQR